MSLDNFALWVGRAFLVVAGFVGTGCALYLAANFAWHQMTLTWKLACVRIWRRDEIREEAESEKVQMKVGDYRAHKRRQREAGEGATDGR